MSYKFTLADIQFLIENNNYQKINEIKLPQNRTSSTLSVIKQIKNRFPISHTSAILETLILREKASMKFLNSQELLFTDIGMQQATNKIVAEYKAKYLLNKIGRNKKILEIGCGIGGDTIQLSKYFDLTVVDKDFVTLKICEHNVNISKPNKKIKYLNKSAEDYNKEEIQSFDLIYIDPARRNSERRVYNLEHFSPSLATIQRIISYGKPVLIKFGPGIKYTDINQYFKNYSLSFISLNGDCKEALILLNFNKKIEISSVILPQQEITGLIDKDFQINESNPLKYIYELDCSLVRAQLVQQIAFENELKMIDKQISLLTGNKVIQNYKIKSFRVITYFSFSFKKLKNYLMENDIGFITIFKKGLNLDVEDLSKRLKPKGKREVIVFLTFVMNEPTIIICEPPEASVYIN